jgi:hypothetical protein
MSLTPDTDGIVWHTMELTEIASAVEGDLLSPERRRVMRHRLDRIATDRAASERLADTTPI